MKKIALVAALFLAACTVDAPVRPMPQFAYKAYPSVVLNVATVNVEQAYASPAQNPNVEHLMPLPLPQAVAEWAKTRFVAGGTEGTATITIRDASVKEQNLPRTTGVKGVFTVDQAERYDATIVVDFAVNGVNGTTNGSGSTTVTRGQSMSEDASIQDRDRAWTKMEEAMLTDLDAGAQQMLRNRIPFAVK